MTLHLRTRSFERADKERFTIDIGNDEAECGTPGKFLARKEFQGGGVLIPGTVLLVLTLAGRFVEERYGVNVRQDSDRHTADGRQVNAPGQVSAIDPADSFNSGEYLYCCPHIVEIVELFFSMPEINKIFFENIVFLHVHAPDRCCVDADTALR